MNKPPLTLSNYIGQEKIKQHLLLQIAAARIRNEPLDHFLVSGPDRIGKATLVNLAAHALGVSCEIFDCAAKSKPVDFAMVIVRLHKNDFLILEHLELISKSLEQVLISVIESLILDIEENEARNHIKLPRFTVVGLTSQPHQISNRLHELFLFHHEFEPYSVNELTQLIDLFIKDIEQIIMPNAANLLAKYCKGTLDDARRLTKKVADYCLVKSKSRQIAIGYNDVKSALDYLGYTEEINNSDQISNYLRKMNGVEFEKYIANLFFKMGYKVETTRATGDHGIDLLLKRNNDLTVVQCKRWDKPIGEPVIRDFYGSLHHSGAKRGLIVATTTFTPQAHSFVNNKPILLIDIDKLIELIKTYRQKNS